VEGEVGLFISARCSEEGGDLVLALGGWGRRRRYHGESFTHEIDVEGFLFFCHVFCGFWDGGGGLWDGEGGDVHGWKIPEI